MYLHDCVYGMCANCSWGQSHFQLAFRKCDVCKIDPPPKKKNPMHKLYVICFLFCVCVFTGNYALFKQRNLFLMFSLVDNIYSVKSEGMVFIIWCFASWLKISLINLILENNVACDFQSVTDFLLYCIIQNRPVFFILFKHIHLHKCSLKSTHILHIHLCNSGLNYMTLKHHCFLSPLLYSNLSGFYWLDQYLLFLKA